MKADSESLTAGTNHQHSRSQRILAWLLRLELLWFFFCLFGGRNSEVFRSASDRLEDTSRILALTVVNPALQLLLIVVATWFINARSRTATAIGVAVASLNAVLILGHIVTSLIIA